MHPNSRPCISDPTKSSISRGPRVSGPRSPIDEWARSGPRRKPTNSHPTKSSISQGPRVWGTWPPNLSPPIGINHLVIVRGGCAHDCPDTCAWQVTVQDGKAVKLAGVADHPYTHGGLCAKVNHYLDRVYSPDRILHPLRRSGAKGEGRFERVRWDEALRDIAEHLHEIIASDGGEAVLPYSFAGNMGLIQYAKMDRRFFARLGASRLARTICGDTANAGVVTALGTSTGCLPEDIEHARFIVLWGTSTVVTNLHLWPYNKTRARGRRHSRRHRPDQDAHGPAGRLARATPAWY